MSCNCDGTQSGMQRGIVSTFIPSTGSSPASGGGMAMHSHGFCWKCFLFWALVALVAVLVLTGDDE